MEWYRSILLALTVFLAYTIWQTYQQEHGVPVVSSPVADQTEIPVVDLPISSSGSLPQGQSSGWPVVQAAQADRILDVKTDVLRIKIDTKGGDIVQAALLKYPQELKHKKPVLLLNQNPEKYWMVQTGILGHGSPDQKSDRAVWTAEKKRYELTENEQELRVALTYQDIAQGIDFKKIFIFSKGSYAIKIRYLINNSGKQAIPYRVWGQFKHHVPHQKSGSLLGINTFTGGVFSSPEHRFEKIALDKLTSQADERMDVANGWVALIEQYFLGAFIPSAKELYQYQARLLPDGRAALSLVSPPIHLMPNQTQEETLTLYLGPQKPKVLSELAPGLDRTIDYGWFWPIAELLFSILSKLQQWVGNWGFAIVLITVLIKAVFYQLSAKSYRSMAKMKKIQPKIEALKERFGDDRQKMSQAMMELYRQEKVNPLGGCLPIVVQIPVFIALYSVLSASVELRMAPFVAWIQDLSVPDPYFVLPILMGISMFFQQRLSPAPPDPTQARIMMFMPIVFTALFLYFPAGLVLYWVVNNVLTLWQQWYIMRKVV